MTEQIYQLDHPDRNIRILAITEIGKRRDEAALPDLLERLIVERDTNVQENITWSLVRFGSLAVSPLIELIEHTDAAVRHYAIHTLGKIGDPQAVEAVSRAIYDSSPTVQLKAAFVLGQIKDPRAIEALLPLLGHESDSIRNTVSDVLELFGSQAVPNLIEALAHEQWQIREHAVEILGLIGDRAAIPALNTTTNDAQMEVRAAARVALHHISGH